MGGDVIKHANNKIRCGALWPMGIDGVVEFNDPGSNPVDEDE